MADSLSGVLARIPGLGGYLAGQQNDQQQQMGQLQQVGALQGILSQVQKQQQEQEMRGVLSRVAQQAGGDPAKMVPLLLQTGTPTGIKLAEGLKGMLPKPAEPYTLAPGGQRRGANNELVAEAPMRPTEAKPPVMRTRIDGDRQIQEEYNADTKAWTPIGQGPRFARQVAGQGGTAFGATQGSLDPVKDRDTIRNLATEALYDSNALSGFRRDTKAMGHIMRERTKLMQAAGVTAEDVVSGRAGFKADTTSLNKITPQYDAITAFEKTAIRNGKILIELANKVDTTGVPVAERWIRAGRKEIGGDPDVAKFHAQMGLYRAEAARILTQPNLSGVLTDTARKEMEEVISNKASAEQVRETVNLLERDFLNRKETLEEQISAIRARMRSRVAPGGREAVAPQAPVPPSAPIAPSAPKGKWSITPVNG